MCPTHLTSITSHDQLPLDLAHVLLLYGHPNDIMLEAYVIWTFEVM